MPLKQVLVGTNQRVVSEDMNAAGDFFRTGLALAVRAFLSPGIAGRIVRGGGVRATGPASKNVEVLPLAGIDAAGNLLIVEALTPKPIGDNVSGNDRIDIVSVGVALTSTDNEPRKFWNPGSEIWFDDPTDTTKTLVVSVTVTQGVPAAIPSPPDPPAGHIALAQVAVADGFAAIQDSDITAVEASLVTPIRSVSWQWSDQSNLPGQPLGAFPYETPDLMTVDTPNGQTTIFFAQLHFKAVATAPQRPLVTRIRDDTGSVVARYDGNSNGNVDDPVSFTPIGVVSGPVARGYRVQVDRVDPGHAPIVTLGDTFDDGAPAINRLIAVTL